MSVPTITLTWCSEGVKYELVVRADKIVATSPFTDGADGNTDLWIEGQDERIAIDESSEKIWEMVNNALTPKVANGMDS